MSDLKPPVLKSWERSDFMLICTSLILPPCVSVLKLIFFNYTLPCVYTPLEACHIEKKKVDCSKAKSDIS